LKRTRLRDATLSATLAGATALACLLVVEVALSFFPAFDPPARYYPGEQPSRTHHKAFVADPELGWRMRPGIRHERRTDEFHAVYVSNDEGFRGTGNFEPPGARRRIAVIGDSVTFGHGVGLEDTWAMLVGAALPDTVVYNFAMPGFGIDQMWLAVRTQALPRKPDLVIVGFINDDFSRSFSAWRPDFGMAKPLFVLDEGGLRPAQPEDRPPAAWRFVEEHSRVLGLGSRLARLVSLRLPVGEWWTLNAAILEAIRADCDAAGTPVLFVYLPTKDVRAFPTLAAHMKGTGALFLDLGQPGIAPDGIHYATDRHPNPRGHRWISDRVIEWIHAELPQLATPSGSADAAAARSRPPS